MRGDVLHSAEKIAERVKKHRLPLTFGRLFRTIEIQFEIILR